MTHYPYLIIGAGMTAAAAARGIREVDSTGTIGMIGAEPDRPYKRPPLSKGLWKGKPLDSIWCKLPEAGVELHLGRRVASLDPGQKQAIDDQGNVYRFDACLLATGGAPRRLSIGADQVIAFRTLEDYRHLLELATPKRRFAVIGGGFIGSEIAAALAMHGQEVSLIFPQANLGASRFPADLSQFLLEYYQSKGVEVRASQRVLGVEPSGSQKIIRTRNQEGDAHAFAADGVVAGLGIHPNVELAQHAGLTVDNGIIVDQFLRTSHPSIYAAGDVAAFYNPAIGKRMRVEHEDNAVTMGRAAGRAMGGQAEAYNHLPFFYSDLFDLGYEAVGEVDARLETFADWQEPFRQGVIYYLQDQRVRGVLLWNVWEQVDAARRLIAEPGPFRPADLKGRLPETS